MLKNFMKVGVVTAAIGGLALVGAPAHADIDTSGNGGVLSGNQVVAPISAPINVCGNSIAVLGIAGAGGSKCAAGVHNGDNNTKVVKRHHHHHHGYRHHHG